LTQHVELPKTSANLIDFIARDVIGSNLLEVEDVIKSDDEEKKPDEDVIEPDVDVIEPDGEETSVKKRARDEGGVVSDTKKEKLVIEEYVKQTALTIYRHILTINRTPDVVKVMDSVKAEEINVWNGEVQARLETIFEQFKNNLVNYKKLPDGLQEVWTIMRKLRDFKDPDTKLCLFYCLTYLAASKTITPAVKTMKLALDMISDGNGGNVWRSMMRYEPRPKVEYGRVSVLDGKGPQDIEQFNTLKNKPSNTPQVGNFDVDDTVQYAQQTIIREGMRNQKLLKLEAERQAKKNRGVKPQSVSNKDDSKVNTQGGQNPNIPKSNTDDTGPTSSDKGGKETREKNVGNDRKPDDKPQNPNDDDVDSARGQAKQDEKKIASILQNVENDGMMDLVPTVTKPAIPNTGSDYLNKTPQNIEPKGTSGSLTTDKMVEGGQTTGIPSSRSMGGLNPMTGIRFSEQPKGTSNVDNSVETPVTPLIQQPPPTSSTVLSNTEQGGVRTNTQISTEKQPEARPKATPVQENSGSSGDRKEEEEKEGGDMTDYSDLEKEVAMKYQGIVPRCREIIEKKVDELMDYVYKYFGDNSKYVLRESDWKDIFKKYQNKITIAIRDGMGTSYNDCLMDAKNDRLSRSIESYFERVNYFDILVLLCERLELKTPVWDPTMKDLREQFATRVVNMILSANENVKKRPIKNK
jgi:hypothetical protein